jgi:hypothetical protein
LPQELAEPVLDAITFAWADFFGDSVNKLLAKWTGGQLHAAGAGGPLFWHPRRASQRGALERIFRSTEKALGELLGHTTSGMERQIEEVASDSITLTAGGPTPEEIYQEERRLKGIAAIIAGLPGQNDSPPKCMAAGK